MVIGEVRMWAQFARFCCATLSRRVQSSFGSLNLADGRGEKIPDKVSSLELRECHMILFNYILYTPNILLKSLRARLKLKRVSMLVLHLQYSNCQRFTHLKRHCVHLGLQGWKVRQKYAMRLLLNQLLTFNFSFANQGSLCCNLIARTTILSHIV